MDPLVTTFPAREEIAARLRRLSTIAPRNRLDEASNALDADGFDGSKDFINTRLMDAFKDTGDADVFALLFELNQQGFLYSIQNRIRSYRGLLEAGDVLQEVFLNIYRYPHRFDGGKPEAFRHWTNTIIRNTVLKHLRSSCRPVRFEYIGEELAARADDRVESPLHESMETEGIGEVRRAYVITLSMYLDAYTGLSRREQQALQLVEVEGLCYRDASAALSIKLENLKMLIFRARRKMYRTMRRRFAVAGITLGEAVA